MRRRRVVVFAVLFGAVAVNGGLLTKVPAWADPPLHEVFLNEPESALPDIDCGTFTMHESSFESRVDVITYFAKSGAAASVRVHVQVHGTLTNLATGKTLRDHGALSATFDFVDGTNTETGISYHYTVPHEGLELATNGRLVFDLETGELLFQAGHLDLTPTNLTLLCSLLA